MAQTLIHAGMPARRGVLPRLRALVHAHRVWRQRQELRTLPLHMLDDLGLTRAEAEAEARRPLWDVPSSWLR